MRTVVIIVVLIGSSFKNVNAQAPSKEGSRFHSFNSIQVLNGSTTTSLAVTTVNGFQNGKLFAGIGTGFDYYYHTSVPLYLEGRLDVLKGKGTLQLFANGGVNFPFTSRNEKQETKTGTYKNGGYYGAGLDYLVPIGGQALMIGAAYSHKQVIQMVENNIWNPVLNRIENTPIKDDYSLNRIALRIGWMF